MVNTIRKERHQKVQFVAARKEYNCTTYFCILNFTQSRKIEIESVGAFIGWYFAHLLLQFARPATFYWMWFNYIKFIVLFSFFRSNGFYQIINVCSYSSCEFGTLFPKHLRIIFNERIILIYIRVDHEQYI